MKKYFIYLLAFVFFACQQNVFAQQATRPTLTPADYEKMIKKYAGLFKNHKKTDGIKIDPQRLADILNTRKDREAALVFARYLKKTGKVNGVRKRVTLLLKVRKQPKGAGAATPPEDFEYIDLGFEFGFCPPPNGCFEDN